MHGQREDRSTHFDPSRTGYNRHWFLGAPADRPADWAAGVRGVLIWNKAKVRANTPVAAEILVSASGPFFEGDAEGAWPMLWNKALIDAWAEINMVAFEEKFPGTIAAARLDLDEGTPHLTLCVVPLYDKKVGGRRVPTVSIRKVFGGETKEDARLNMISWQDWYAARMAPFGLARGVPKATTGRVGLTHQDYRRIKQLEDMERRAAVEGALELEARAAGDADEVMRAAVRMTAQVMATKKQAIAQAQDARRDMELRETKIDEAERHAAEVSAAAAGRSEEAIQLLGKARTYFGIAKKHMVVLRRTMGEMHPLADQMAAKDRALNDFADEAAASLDRKGRPVRGMGGGP